MSKQLNNKFNFFIPASFTKSGENGEMKISGVCSSSVEDSDGETLEPSGFDFQPLLEKGYYNWNHQASKEPGAILGRPTIAKIVNGGKDFYTEGFLYKGLEKAKDLYELAKTLEKEDPNRRLGFSIEGQAIQRDPINPKRITKARITGVAITHCPKNPNTLLNLIKGEYEEPFIEEQVEEIDTEKGGEGSKGGKVIGHTKSGKPIYATKNARHESKFTSQDHNDAAYVHLDHALKLHKEGKLDEADRHNSMFDEHMSTFRHKRSNEELDKSITTSDTPMPESVEGVKKNLVKSEIFQQIFTNYTTDVKKSEDVYKFIQQVSQKVYNMAEITQEALAKAFELLDSSIQKSQKSNLMGEDKKPEDYDKKDEILKNKEEKTTTTTTMQEIEDDEDDEDVEKACLASAKQSLEKGGKRGETIDDLVEKGFSFEMAQGCVDKCIAEMNANKDGGKITTETSIKKGEEFDLQKSFDSLSFQLDQKFNALGLILQKSEENNELLKSQIETLQKSNTQLQQEVNKLSTTPFPTKSVRDVRAFEKFTKSEDGDNGVLSISHPGDRKQIVDQIFDKITIQKSQGRDYSHLEKAVQELEIVKSLSESSINVLGSVGIKVGK